MKSILIPLIPVLGSEPKKLRIDGLCLKQILRIGVPAGVQSAMFSIANIVIQGAINSLGTVVMAASSAAYNIEVITYDILNSFSQACTTFVGQNFGAGEIKRCKKTLLLCLLEGIISLGVAIALILFFGKSLLTIFNGDPQVVEKIVASQAHHKKIDGHAPGLSGKDLNAYIAAGVYSDHECSTMEDALEKLKRGQFIMIREGTAARNLDALLPLLTPQYYTYCMFCTDDKHPNDLLEKGHIDYIVRRAIKAGVDPIIAVKCASHHAARYFLLNNRGAIAPGFLADFVVIDNFDDFNILEVYKKGKLMFDGKTVTPFEAPEIDPHLEATDFIESRPRAVLGMVPGEIVTTDAGYAEKISVEDDILKIAVIERHKNTHHIGIGYIKGYGLKSGAVATSISHDSHNIIVVGANEEDMAAAVNRVVELGGGIVVMDDGKVLGELQLQIAGIMSEAPLIEVNEALENAKEQAFKLGVSRGVDPFMTLSFMALTVIPTLRLTTRGVFDVINQRYV